MSNLDTRSYDGTPISRRVDDGYYNLTAMCQAGGKQWRDYARLNRCAEQLRAISRSVRICTELLIVSVTTGPNDSRGTWIHPQVAVDRSPNLGLHPEALWTKTGNPLRPTGIWMRRTPPHPEGRQQQI